MRGPGRSALKGLRGVWTVILGPECFHLGLQNHNPTNRFFERGKPQAVAGVFSHFRPTGESARIYPMKVWSEIEDKLAKVSSQNRAKRKFLMRTSYYGQTVELDGQGRVLVPAVLRESAQMKGEVDVFGNLDYLEVMNHARVFDSLKNEPYTSDDDKALEDLGI